jgi:3-carboxy-cis,cis-muconate cycloisomerase
VLSVLWCAKLRLYLRLKGCGRTCESADESGEEVPVPEDGLFGALYGNPDVDRETGGAAWLQAMLDVERSLAAAQARAGLVPAQAAAAIGACCVAGRFDVAEIGKRALAAGNPVVPLVRDLRSIVPPEAERYVHYGATSQDILDTAMMLVVRRALGPILADLRAAAARCAELAAEHAGTLMAGRTLLQQALPITFGLKCAGWLTAIDETARNIVTLRASRLAVQLGGAAGTLASLGEAGTTVLRLLAEELQLAEPVTPWHTDRARVAEIGCGLGRACGALAKVALDVLLMAQTEVAEVREANITDALRGWGGSSTLPHKQNPVGAVLVTACAKRAPGLAATLLASMAAEHERAAGAWHAEWDTLTGLVRVTGGAAHHGAQMLAGLQVSRLRMGENLGATRGLIMAENVVARLAGALGKTQAAELVTRVSLGAAGHGEHRQPLRDALLAEPAVAAHLSPDELDAALDPGHYLGSARQFIDRAIARHAAGDGGTDAGATGPGAADTGEADGEVRAR